jgi:hypothetical protein
MVVPCLVCLSKEDPSRIIQIQHVVPFQRNDGAFLSSSRAIIPFASYMYQDKT